MFGLLTLVHLSRYWKAKGCARTAVTSLCFQRDENDVDPEIDKYLTLVLCFFFIPPDSLQGIYAKKRDRDWINKKHCCRERSLILLYHSKLVVILTSQKSAWTVSCQGFVGKFAKHTSTLLIWSFLLFVIPKCHMLIKEKEKIKKIAIFRNAANFNLSCSSDSISDKVFGIHVYGMVSAQWQQIWLDNELLAVPNLMQWVY